MKPVYILIPSATLLIGYGQMKVLFATNKQQIFTAKKDSANLRIIDWNIRSFTGMGKSNAAQKRAAHATIPESILAQNADIVCLQEFNNSDVQNNIALFQSKYRYYYFSKDFSKQKFHYQTGNIIFSKYPIVDTGKISLPGPQGGSLIYADIQTPQKTIRLYTTHLQSFRFKPDDYEKMEEIKKTGEQTLPASKSLLQKMKLAYKNRGEQADLVRTELDKASLPSIVCGDFNDVPNSYTYFHIRGKRHDAFLKTSLGIGRSFLALAPTLRIDYILPDTSFVVKQFDLIDEDLSDHLMLVTDVQLK